jgi:osmotically inducible protein OsmC
MFQPLYTATATAHGGREGKVQTDDGQVSHALAMPTALGGKGGAGTNPEQLFASGFAACFESALRLVARMQRKPLKDATITAKVTIGKTDDGGFGLAAELHGHLEGVSRDEAQALMEAAHQVCPYSKATRGNIEVKLIAE